MCSYEFIHFSFLGPYFKMPCWYYEKKELKKTPSIQDGIDYETECRYRKEGARFIIETGSKMDLGYNTMATGVVYFHRFYMFHSFKNFPRYVTACCCLFLAGKVEETPKKCKDIIKIAKSLLSEQKFATFGEDPKEEVMTLERILLQTIKFDLQVEHPYSYLLKYAKCLKGEKSKVQKMVQMAWTFINDSLCTTLSLQWEPEIIAVALMYLAGKLSTFEVTDWSGKQPKHLRWWDMFLEDVEMDLLEGICHQVLDLYSPANNAELPDSPPSTPSKEPIREKFTIPQAIDVTLHASAPTIKPPKPGPSTVPTNGASLDTPDSAKTPALPPHFMSYASNFPIPNANYPPIFPNPVNLGLPPPAVNAVSHITPTIHPVNSAGFLRPLTAPTPSTLNPYQYQTNATYFSNNNQPLNSQRGFYPPP